MYRVCLSDWLTGGGSFVCRRPRTELLNVGYVSFANSAGRRPVRVPVALTMNRGAPLRVRRGWPVVLVETRLMFDLLGRYVD